MGRMGSDIWEKWGGRLVAIYLLTYGRNRVATYGKKGWRCIRADRGGAVNQGSKLMGVMSGVVMVGGCLMGHRFCFGSW